MRIGRQWYQVGSVRKVPELTVISRGSSGSMLQTRAAIVNSAFRHSTRRSISPKDVRTAVEGQLAALNADTLGGKIAITFGQVMDRYIAEELPTLKLSLSVCTKMDPVQ